LKEKVGNRGGGKGRTGIGGRVRGREGAEWGDRVGKWDGGLGLDFVQGTPSS